MSSRYLPDDQHRALIRKLSAPHADIAAVLGEFGDIWPESILPDVIEADIQRSNVVYLSMRRRRDRSER